MDPQPRNLAQLATALESAWLNIPENTFRDLSDSLPARLAAVRSAKASVGAPCDDPSRTPIVRSAPKLLFPQHLVDSTTIVNHCRNFPFHILIFHD
ncbi:transposable element Tcb1 transposase [Trichonephila clavipes]|nr:transposable element Tcb1 transposase [Trichonephila clavipes]